jgi:hypothetical protein
MLINSNKLYFDDNYFVIILPDNYLLNIYYNNVSILLCQEITIYRTYLYYYAERPQTINNLLSD